MGNYSPLYIGFFDLPDPDNFIAIAALMKLAGKSIPVVLTGRALNLNADSNTELFEAVERDCLKGIEVGSSRIKNFCRYFDFHDVRVFNGDWARLTIIPHKYHFADHYAFREPDYDPVRASEYPELEPLSEVIKMVLDEKQDVVAVVGGPFTGLASLLERGFRKIVTEGNESISYERVCDYIKEVHVMGPSVPDLVEKLLGESQNDKVMDLVPGRTQSQQFNILCDPKAFDYCYKSLPNAKWSFCPTQVTKVQSIGFRTPMMLQGSLPQTKSAKAFCYLYDNGCGGGWYNAALKSRGEWIYIHDLSSVISASLLRNDIYDWVPCSVDYVYKYPVEVDKLGVVDMSVVEDEHSLSQLAYKVKSQRQYMEYLYSIFE